MIQLLLQYYGVMNLLAFAAFAADYLGKKFFIIRMPERIMVMLTACGGGIGALSNIVRAAIEGFSGLRFRLRRPCIWLC